MSLKLDYTLYVYVHVDCQRRQGGCWAVQHRKRIQVEEQAVVKAMD